MPFHSILFDQPGSISDLTTPIQPDFFDDLRLDRVLATLTAGRQEYDLAPFFFTPLHSLDAIQYRHAVLRDVERPAVLSAIRAFAEQMVTVRASLRQLEKLRDPYQQQRWLLDAAAVYVDGVRRLAGSLASDRLRSPGFIELRQYLDSYVASKEFGRLDNETAALLEALAGVRYTVHIKDLRVTVNRYDHQPDYGAEVEETFDKFRQGAVADYRAGMSNRAETDRVEAQVLALVAKLFPEVFQPLADYWEAHRSFVDETIERFDREVQFYLAWLEYMGSFESSNLTFCFPKLSNRSKTIRFDKAFDLPLATKLMSEGTEVITNDAYLSTGERIIVVTGPNQGGKTTFARMFGQLHYLAALGLTVPASEAHLFLADRIFTHFEREEDLSTSHGKLEDELVRIHRILQEATGSSILIMNESFSSATLEDALVLGTAVMRQMVAIGLLAVYVTFVDELASLSETVVSMASTVEPDNPAKRTFKIVRKPADGLAYAWALAEKYGLRYEQFRRRLAA